MAEDRPYERGAEYRTGQKDAILEGMLSLFRFPSISPAHHVDWNARLGTSVLISGVW